MIQRFHPQKDILVALKSNLYLKLNLIEFFRQIYFLSTLS